MMFWRGTRRIHLPCHESRIRSTVIGFRQCRQRGQGNLAALAALRQREAGAAADVALLKCRAHLVDDLPDHALESLSLARGGWTLFLDHQCSTTM
ncbi:hypothetical protein ADL35_31820 [Streptomyces sp. NRRL WC-3753]|nr:hypothetical protein ADL35_31820 [Streptomyces sp. NRRL WC-3753]